MYRFFFFLSFFLYTFSFSAQSSISNVFGEPTDYEYTLKTYDRDPDAPAVVLYDKGEYSVTVKDRYVRLIKKVHRKIKVLDVNRYSDYTFEIPYYRERSVQENITNLTGITHNGALKDYVSEASIIDSDDHKNWSIRKFTFPNVQNGSILEYTYQIETPYLTNIGDWFFGHDIPTIYSELETTIPANYLYHRSLFGDQKLFINHAEIKKSCFQPEGYRTAADCEYAVYAMRYLPAYKDEPLMLSMENYKPALHFEIMESYRTEHVRTNYSKTWRDVENRLKNSSNFGKQLKHTSYFKEKLPNSIGSIVNPVDRAKAVYYFIQNQFTWNGKYRILNDIDVKNAFEQKSGNVSEINFALLNALEASGIDAEIMLLPSRDNALVTRQHPTLFSFNYAIVFVKINNETFLLDATDKFTPFGILPIRALNMEGRVFNLKTGSRWEPITPSLTNMHYLNMQLSADEAGIFRGKTQEVSTGYISYLKRTENRNKSVATISNKKQSENEHILISDYEIENQNDLDEPYKESFSVELENQSNSDRLFLYPFLIKPHFTENPFSAPIREFPIDFAFPVINNYLVTIDLNNQYEVIKMPENKRITFPDNDAELSVMYELNNSQIQIRLLLKLNTIYYPAEALGGLQTLLTTLIDIQKNQPIELRKL